MGRSPVYVLGSLAFCIVNIGTALAKNVPTILVLRFVGGFVGSAPISVGGATLMEIYGPSEVPYAIAFYAVSGVCRPILGPVSPSHGYIPFLFHTDVYRHWEPS